MDAGKMIEITRIFDAPREMVFNAWSDPKYLLRWYAPNGCTISIRKMDFRKGGIFHHCISTPNGDCWCKGFYKEIIKPERISFTLGFSDEQGNSIDSSPVGKDPEWPMETIVTLTFEEFDGKTKFTLRQNALESVAKRTGAYPSWLEMFDRLDTELKSSFHYSS